MRGGADRLCFVISPGKVRHPRVLRRPRHGHADLLRRPADGRPGLCDAIFRALPLIDADEPVLVGLPDTVWFPTDGLRDLPDDVLSFLLFPVERPAAVRRGRARWRRPRHARSR